MRALVLSGGGAHGSFGLGVINSLWDRGWRWDAFFGTSTGSILAAMMAQDKLDEMTDMWLSIKGDRDIYDSSTLGNAWRLARKGGLYGIDPLHRLLQDHVSWDSVEHFLYVSCVDLASGHTFAAPTAYPLADGVAASCSFPPAFGPFEVGLRKAMDGGLREICPVKAAVSLGYDVIDIVLNTMGGIATMQDIPRDAYGVAKRVISIVSHEVLLNDLNAEMDRIELINELTSMGMNPDGRSRIIKVNIYEPMRLEGAVLDFSPRYTHTNYQHGLLVGQAEPKRKIV